MDPKDGITLVTVQPGSFRPKGNDGGLPGYCHRNRKQ